MNEVIEVKEAILAEVKTLKAGVDQAKHDIASVIQVVENLKAEAETKEKKTVDVQRDVLEEAWEQYRAENKTPFDLMQKQGGRRLVLSTEGKSLFKPLDIKTTVTSATVGASTPGILTPERVGYVPAVQRRLTLRDIIPSRPTSNAMVEFVKENAFTNAASPQVEASAKAETALTFTIDYETVRTLAHWIPATRQVLDDWPALQRIITDKMMYGLKLKEEEEILSGSGSGVHLSGLTTNATSYADTYNAANDTIIDTLRHGILEANDDNEEVNFMVLNPKEWHDVQLVKDAATNIGQYVYGDPKGGIVANSLWGIPVVVSTAMTAGYFLLGNTAQCEIFDRQTAVVDVSLDYDDYFVKNLVAIRVEERLAFCVYRAGAFIYGAV